MRNRSFQLKRANFTLENEKHSNILSLNENDLTKNTYPPETFSSKQQIMSANLKPFTLKRLLSNQIEKKILDVELNNRKCKICFEKETAENPLIAPCQCSGSIKYVHNDCLKKWIIGKESNVAKAKCEICQTYYDIEVVYENMVDKEKQKKFLKKEGLFTLGFILFVFFLNWAIVTFIFKKFIKTQSWLSYFTLTSYSLSLVFCLCVLCFVFSKYRRKCYYLTIKSWEIKDYRKENKFFLKIIPQQLYGNNVMNSSVSPVINNYV